MAADREKIICVGIPAISMGVYAYPPEEAVPILVEAALATRAQLNHVREIRFVVGNSDLFKLFRQTIDAASETS